MTTKIAINGFGRIGRQVYRALLERNFLDGKVEVVVINDLVPADNLAYLLKYDSVHGRLKQNVKVLDDSTIQIGDHTLKTVALKAHPRELPWKEYWIDLVIESTGFFAKKDDAMGHIEAGAKKVIISAPSDQDVKTIVMGVNNAEYTGEQIVSNASCTTNCLAPMVHVLLTEGIWLEEGLMSTIHAYTGTQAIVDGTSRKEFREGRAAALNIIPTTTGAAKMVGKVIPAVNGKLTGVSYRVPVGDSSLVDLTFKPTKATSLEEIHAAFKKASETYMAGIMSYTDEPVVSSDFIHDSHSCVYDAGAAVQLNDRFFKIAGWYDNERWYSNRMVDLLDLVVSYKS
mgnify:CR=1 FL=1